jgi:hypothetical protein
VFICFGGKTLPLEPAVHVTMNSSSVTSSSAARRCASSSSSIDFGRIEEDVLPDDVATRLERPFSFRGGPHEVERRLEASTDPIRFVRLTGAAVDRAIHGIEQQEFVFEKAWFHKDRRVLMPEWTSRC